MCIRDRYSILGIDFLDELNGIFGFAIYDTQENEFFISRDHVGVIPLYIGWDQNGTFYVASELKALEGVCSKIELFPPGNYLHSKNKELTPWYKRDWMDYKKISRNETKISDIHNSSAPSPERTILMPSDLIDLAIKYIGVEALIVVIS